MEIKERIKKILSIFDKFDTSNDKAVKMLRYELYLIAIGVLIIVGMRLFFESWLLITFLPADWFNESMIPEIKTYFDPVITIVTYDFDILTIIPFLWYIVVFIASTIIIIKIKRYFRNLIIKYEENEKTKITN